MSASVGVKSAQCHAFDAVSVGNQCDELLLPELKKEKDKLFHGDAAVIAICI